MKKTQRIATYVLLAVLITALTVPCVHAHEDSHDGAQHHHAEHWEDILRHHDDHGHFKHGHDHDDVAHEDHHHDHHPSPAADSGHVHIQYNDDPIADLLLSRLEHTLTGHTHHVAIHAHFFNGLQEKEPRAPSPFSHAFTNEEHTQAGNTVWTSCGRPITTIAPALASLTYISLINNIPPPARA